jgi:hypothetical protein
MGFTPTETTPHDQYRDRPHPARPAPHALAGWDRLDPGLKALAVMASAATIGRSWCMVGYWESTQRGIDPKKLRDVPQ